MIRDWKKEIAIAWYVKNETANLDTDGLWEYPLPKVAATEQQLAEAETTIGRKLNQRYREFLSFANGWRCFYQDVCLFGTEEFANGPLMVAADFALQESVPDGLKLKNAKAGDLLPIAKSTTDRDLFAIGLPNTSVDGQVIWFSGGEIERFARFDDYFLAMVDYNRVEYQNFKNRAG